MIHLEGLENADTEMHIGTTASVFRPELDFHGLQSWIDIFKFTNFSSLFVNKLAHHGNCCSFGVHRGIEELFGPD